MSARLFPWTPVLIVLVCLAFPGAAFTQEAAPADRQIEFARSLLKEGDQYRAITEAKRFLFLYPEDPRQWEARLLIAQAYRDAGRWTEARVEYAPIAVQREKTGIAAQAILELGRCLERTSPVEAEKYYRDIEGRNDLPPGHEADLRNRARYRLGWLYLEAGRWDEARAVFGKVDSTHALSGPAADLARESERGRQLPRKSPEFAGLLSAVLPGAGQAYVGRGTDAVLAFTLNALFLYGTIDAANNQSWGVFTLLGLMELGWYGGNIYNAVNGAHIENQEKRDRFLQQLRRERGLDVGWLPSERAFVLSWSHEF